MHTTTWPTEKFELIIADPPWSFLTRSAKGKERSPEQHYACMTLEDIKKLPVVDLAAKDCVLLLWVTDPLLPAGLDVMREWGFEFKTVGFNWAKTLKSGKPGFALGMGYWTRANPELCLLGTRGRPARVARNVRRLVVEPVREHSRKPDSVYTEAMRLTGATRGLELFARTDRGADWVCWGNEQRF